MQMDSLRLPVFAFVRFVLNTSLVEFCYEDFSFLKEVKKHEQLVKKSSCLRVCTCACVGLYVCTPRSARGIVW